MEKKLSFNDMPDAIAGLYVELAQLNEKMGALEQLIKNALTAPTVAREDELLTISQAAEYLTLTVSTIYVLVAQQKIPHSKKGKRLYFSKQELEQWIKTGRKKTVAEINEEKKPH